MSLFGDRKFGTFKFGSSLLARPRFALRVDWDSDGIFDGSNEVIAGNGMSGFRITRGRRYYVSPNGDGFQVEDTGSFSASFHDRDRRYDAYNSSSPLYGTLAGGKLFDFIVRSPTDQIYSVMNGILNTPVFSQERNNMHTARLEGTDGWSVLRDQRNLVTIALQENIFADDAIGLLLTEANWPTLWGRDLDAGVDERNFWWVDQRSPAAAIHELAHTELGRVWVAANGRLTFRSALNVDSPVLTLTGDDIEMGGLRRLQPDEIVRNLIRVKSSRPVEYSQADLWQMQDRLRIQPGQSETIWANYTYNSVEVAATDVVTPVASTDYSATANQDGTGADLTGNISITMYSYSTKAYLVVTNTGLDTAWFTSKVRGNPIVLSNSTTFEGADLDSQRLYGVRPFELEIQQDVNTARQYVDVLKAMLSPARVYLMVDLQPNPDVQFGADLGQQVLVQVDDINEVFQLISIEHQSSDELMSIIRTRWILEPVSRVLAGIKIPMQIPFQVGNL